MPEEKEAGLLPPRNAVNCPPGLSREQNPGVPPNQRQGVGLSGGKKGWRGEQPPRRENARVNPAGGQATAVGYFGVEGGAILSAD